MTIDPYSLYQCNWCGKAMTYKRVKVRMVDNVTCYLCDFCSWCVDNVNNVHGYSDVEWCYKFILDYRKRNIIVNFDKYPYNDMIP